MPQIEADMSTLASRIELMRTTQGIGKRELTKRFVTASGQKRASLSRLRLGQNTDCTVSTFIAVCNVLKADPDFLLAVSYPQFLDQLDQEEKDIYAEIEQFEDDQKTLTIDFIRSFMQLKKPVASSQRRRSRL